MQNGNDNTYFRRQCLLPGAWYVFEVMRKMILEQFLT
jgi:hypothetical protein